MGSLWSIQMDKQARELTDVVYGQGYRKRVNRFDSANDIKLLMDAMCKRGLIDHFHAYLDKNHPIRIHVYRWVELSIEIQRRIIHAFLKEIGEIK
jgi:hypothetical protein